MRQIHVSHWCKLAAVRVAGDQSHRYGSVFWEWFVRVCVRAIEGDK